MICCILYYKDLKAFTFQKMEYIGSFYTEIMIYSEPLHFRHFKVLQIQILIQISQQLDRLAKCFQVLSFFYNVAACLKNTSSRFFSWVGQYELHVNKCNIANLYIVTSLIKKNHENWDFFCEYQNNVQKLIFIPSCTRLRNVTTLYI